MTVQNQTKASYYYAPPLAASLSLIPTFYGFMIKSAQQLGEPIPRLTLGKVAAAGPNAIPKVSIGQVLIRGTVAAPFVGGMVGGQILAARGIENRITKKDENGQKIRPSYSTMLLSATAVGAISIPPVAILNGLSVGQSPVVSIKNLTPMQGAAILVRDGGFLLALRVRGPLTEQMTDQFGAGKVVEYGVPFLTGAIGRLVGQPADTALTLWQKKKPVTFGLHLMKGTTANCVSLGAFSVIFSIIMKKF